MDNIDFLLLARGSALEGSSSVTALLTDLYDSLIVIERGTSIVHESLT